jgi:acyl-CoA synthetase (NDP forming)
VIFIPPLVTRPEEVAAAIRESAAALDGAVPILSVFMSASGAPPELRGNGRRVPSFQFPEEASRALARAVRYGEWRERPEGRFPHFDDLQEEDATALIASALVHGPRWLDPGEVSGLLGCYGLSQAEFRLAATPEEAGAAAEELGGPVALKAVAPGLVHKTEAGGVRTGIGGAADVQRAAQEMGARVRRAGHEVERFLVQSMVPAGVEMLVGVVHDPLFGPVIACGAGGTAVELLKDVSVRITPLSTPDAGEMVRSLATFPLLDGYRGAPKANVPALEELLLRVSALVEAHPEIAEMDLNPVMVTSQGATLVDARIRIQGFEAGLPLSARRR